MITAFKQAGSIFAPLTKIGQSLREQAQIFNLQDFGAAIGINKPRTPRR